MLEIEKGMGHSCFFGVVSGLVEETRQHGIMGHNSVTSQFSSLHLIPGIRTALTFVNTL